MNGGSRWNEGRYQDDEDDVYSVHDEESPIQYPPFSEEEKEARRVEQVRDGKLADRAFVPLTDLSCALSKLETGAVGSRREDAQEGEAVLAVGVYIDAGALIKPVCQAAFCFGLTGLVEKSPYFTGTNRGCVA